jgi:hypothetical protein
MHLDESPESKRATPMTNFRPSTSTSASRWDAFQYFDVLLIFISWEITKRFPSSSRSTRRQNIGRRAEVEVDGRKFVIGVALFDSGDSSRCILENHLERRVVKVKNRVRVANGQCVNISGMVNLSVSFRSDDGTTTTANLDFLILDGLTMELVIGLPTIVREFKSLFVEMLNSDLSEGEINVISVDHWPIGGGGLEPWEKNSGGLSQEEEELPEPASFPPELCFMQTSIREAEEKYLLNFPERVAPEFQQERVLHFLREIGKDVFVPRNWTGIKGIEPLKLEFSENMPTRMKPARREIPVKCAEAAKKEFERMSTYFYQPSTSPITSPLVVAPKATAPFIRICGDYRKINEYVKASNYPIPNVIHELHKVSKFKIFSDLDVANAFHEIRLHPDTGRRLSVQTPWGQFEPVSSRRGVTSIGSAHACNV